MPFSEFDLRIRVLTVEDDDIEPIEPQYQIDVYDDEGEWYAQTVNKDFKPAFKHALYLANPALAAALFDDFFEWTQLHEL